ncbi:MAG: PEP-CTERM sorting domain-containing protein [Lacipirellulaceae bacterium]
MKLLAVFCAVFTATHLAQAATVTLSPTDIHGNDTNTASFSNGDLTLTPFIGATQDTFNGNPTRLGLDNAGTNNNAFNDPDTDPNNGNEEILEFIFSPLAGLSQIVWDFSRADGPGPDDAVTISGFVSDPGATITPGVSVTNPNTVSFSGGVLSLDITGQNFGGALDSVTLANPGASAGQTLILKVTDTTQGGAQLAIRSISYETIPEPTSLVLFGLAGICMISRRR